MKIRFRSGAPTCAMQSVEIAIDSYLLLWNKHPAKSCYAPSAHNGHGRMLNNLL
jgi:hypothetical protein